LRGAQALLAGRLSFDDVQQVLREHEAAKGWR
jgi:hypothetical protein